MNSLVDYASSSSDEESDSKQDKQTIGQKKRKRSAEIESSRMPKLPAFFNTLVATSPINRLEKNSEHKGRIRTVPHKEDNWATHIYFRVDLTSEMKALTPHLKQNERIELIEEQHISISRPVYFKKYQLDTLIEDVKNALRGLHSFKVSFAQPSMLTNDEKTRAFYTLEIGKGYNELNACMQLVDKVMEKHRQPVFYDPPRFHTSIAWALDEKDIAAIDIPAVILQPVMNDDYLLTKVYIKMGNRIEIIDLR